MTAISNFSPLLFTGAMGLMQFGTSSSGGIRTLLFGTLPVCCVYVLAISAQLSSAVTESLSIDVIKQEWDTRPATIPSFEYTFDVTEEFTRFRRQRRGTPFDDPTAGIAVGSVSTGKQMTVKRQGSDMRFTVDGEQCDMDNYEVISQTITSVFHEETVKSVLNSSRATHGSGAFGNRDTSIVGRAMPIEGALVLMWYDPASILEQSHIEVASAQIANKNVPRQDGNTYAELVVRRPNGVISKLIVQTHPPYLPVEIITSNQNVPLSAMRWNYSEHPQHGPHLNSWSYQLYRGDGVLFTEKRGALKEFIYGRQIDQSEFSLTFPIGTRITEYRADDQRQEWIQISEDEMKRVEARIIGSPSRHF